jgi:hypothetical protein
MLSLIVLGLVALVAANLPFISQRIFFIRRPTHKRMGWRVLELAVLYLILGLFARWLESRVGEVYPQGWEFYAVTLSLFLVLAYPGFVYRYLWRHDA